MGNNSKKFKKFKKAPLLLSFAFLLASSYAFVFLYMKVGENKEISLKAHAEWQAEANRRDEIRSLARSIKEIQAERTELETHFAESSNIVPFLDTLEKLAVLAGAKADVKSVDIEEEKSELTVSIQTIGSFESTYKFIRLLENSPYELEIISFDIKKSGAGEWAGLFKIRLLSFVK
ncbi:hypothetical protein HYW73_00330 [Candidatus Nomurabacteria bacterium]|nr:hypothetical protein [Candidatus Nomurabacteria bacterium]